jgi:transcriptional regulator of acetoin/glycerol metabolism
MPAGRRALRAGWFGQTAGKRVIRVTFVNCSLTRTLHRGSVQSSAIGGKTAVSTSKASPHADLVHSVVGHQSNTVTQPAVDLSWRRCLNTFKLDPAREYETRVLDTSRLKERQSELAELVQIARAEMDSLYEQISGSGYALLLAHTRGVILCEKVDPTLKTLFSGAGLIIGAEWSEECEGTNGIGTCATEGRPITIHQADHFRSRHVGLSCSAAPIHDPHGRVIAVLDASCLKAEGPRESQLHTVALVNSSARLIEKCLFLRCHRGDALLRFHHRPEFVDLLHDGAIAMSPDGSIVASDSIGLRLLGAEDRGDLVGRSIADIFDTTLDELLATAGSRRRPIWELRDNRYGRRYYASLVEAGSSTPPGTALPASSRTIVHVSREPKGTTLTLEEMAGDDPQMIRNMRNARRIAESTVSVLIQGATGTGKEAFAKALHAASQRARKPFVAVNCAAIPESLIESELFGYSAGAFTGAKREGKRGLIVQSSGGTLFLDEIGDMPLLMQSRLLRVLQEQEVTPLGSETITKVDLRVICASHRNLPELIADGRFREDLYYRLNGITLELPALAARRDKEALIRKCIARESGDAEVGSIESGALDRLLAYSWPGNIRELRNTIRTALAICEDRIIRASDLPDVIKHHHTPGVERAPPPETEAISLAAAERDALLRAIELHDGHMTRVANHLGISRNTLYRKIKLHGIQLSRRPKDP